MTPLDESFWPDWALHIWFEDFLGVFLAGFTVTLLLPLIVAGCAAVVFFRVPRAFGIANLFWQPSVTGRIIAGLGMGALLWQTFLAGYLFEPMATNFTQDRPPFCDAQPPVGSEKPEDWNPNRRHEPKSLNTVGLYLAALIRGALVGIPVLLIVGIAALAVAGLTVRVWKIFEALRDRAPDKPDHKRVGYQLRALAGEARLPLDIASVVWRAVRSPRQSSATPPVGRAFPRYHRAGRWLALPLGIVAGFVLTAGISSALWHADDDDGLAYRIGQSMVRGAGWGKAEARGKFSKLMSTKMSAESSPVESTGGAESSRQYYRDQFPGEKLDTVVGLRPYFAVFGAFVVTFGLLVGIYLVFLCVDVRWSNFTPASGILFVGHVILAAHIVLTYFVATPHLLNLALLFLMLTAAVPFKLRFRGISATPAAAPLRIDRYDAPVPLKKYDPKAKGSLLDPNDVDFLAVPVPPRIAPKRPMAIVCVSGGGSRAAAWTMKMLTLLEERFEAAGVARATGYDFPYDIRMITGASGGMIAGAYYAASLDEPGPDGEVKRYPVPRIDAPKSPRTREELNKDIRADFLTPIARKMAFWDLASIFVPAVFRKDRGTALEQSWDLSLHGVMSRTFAQLKPGEKDGWRPSLIFSPMTVDDGRQLFIGNLDMINVTENRGNILRGNGDPQDDLLSREGWGFFKIFPESYDSFTIGTAARMSASFPFVLPAVELPTDPPLRVVDAGYYDNYGVGVAAEWLFAKENMDWVRENCSGVVIIQIRDGVSEAGRRDQSVGLPPAPDRFTRGLHWLSSPVEGLYSFRAQSTAYRNDNLLAMLSERFNRTEARNVDGSLIAPQRAFFQTVALELPCGDEVSLNFTLTSEELAQIDLGAENATIRNRIAALIRWWTTRP